MENHTTKQQHVLLAFIILQCMIHTWSSIGRRC